MSELQQVRESIRLHSDILVKSKVRLEELLRNEDRIIQEAIKVFTSNGVKKELAQRKQYEYQSAPRDQIYALMRIIVEQIELIDRLTIDEGILSIHTKKTTERRLAERYNEGNDALRAQEILSAGRESHWPLGGSGQIKSMANDYIEKSIFQLESTLFSGYSGTQTQTCKAYIKVMRDELSSRGAK